MYDITRNLGLCHQPTGSPSKHAQNATRRARTNTCCR